MKLIVGLGNPGKQYHKTRHNIGFILLDYFALKHNISIDQEKFNGLYGEYLYNGEKIILLKPQKYMNLSGEVVKRYIDYFKIKIEDILIVSDDLDMDFGRYRLRLMGSSGGHNGLKNIEQNIGTNHYKRLKIGISNNKDIDTKDYVLGKFSQTEQKILNDKLEILNNILEDYLVLSFENLMNKYNKNI